MHVEVFNDDRIRLVDDGDANLAIDGPFGPLPMLATSLATCTAAVMRSYATTAQFRLERFVIEVTWSYAERPRRIGRIEMRLLVGPEVPPSRQEALLRAAESQCTVHNTLSHTPGIVTTLEVAGAQQA